MRFSDVTAVAVTVAVDVDEISIVCDRKTPIFNIAFAASNSNAKSNPETKFLFVIFKLLSGDCEEDDDDDEDSRDNDLRFFFKR